MSYNVRLVQPQTVWPSLDYMGGEALALRVMGAWASCEGVLVRCAEHNSKPLDPSGLARGRGTIARDSADPPVLAVPLDGSTRPTCLPPLWGDRWSSRGPTRGFKTLGGGYPMFCSIPPAVSPAAGDWPRLLRSATRTVR